MLRILKRGEVWAWEGFLEMMRIAISWEVRIFLMFVFEVQLVICNRTVAKMGMY